MKEFIFSLKWAFALIPFFSFSQLPENHLRSEQPAEIFFPLKITTSDSIFSGYGNVNTITYNSLIFTSKKPIGRTKDWILIKKFDQAQLMAKDTLMIVPIVNTINENKKQRIMYLTSFVYENKELKVYKYLSRFFEEAYAIIPQNMPYINQNKKIIVIKTEKTFRRFANRAFKKCEKLTIKVNSNFYSNDFQSLILLVDDYQKYCSEIEW